MGVKKEGQVGIDCQQIVYAYSTEPILQDITVTIPKNSFTIIVGPNGAGKTTFLRLLGGLLTPQKGCIYMGGETVESCQKAGHIHLVPQLYNRNAAQFPATVEEVVGLAFRMGAPKEGKSTKEQIHKALHLVGMAGLAKRRIGDLSGGQQQRVMLAQALLCKPTYLLLDEPTSGVDMEGSAHIFNLLKKIQEENQMTIIMVTHDIDDASKVADYTLCIDRHVCYFGDCKGFLTSHTGKKLAWHMGVL